jgi:diaminopimelate epimerase
LAVQTFEENHRFAKYIQGVTPYWCSIGHIVLFLSPEQWSAIEEDKAYDELFTHFNKMKYSNINFCRIDSEESIRIATCELGAGVTYACGTGSTSAAFVAHRLGRAKATVNMENRGGRIIITTVDKGEGKYQLLMNGPAEYAYSGII